MKILKSTNLVIALVLVITSIYGWGKGLALLCLCFGLREFITAKEHCDKQQKKWAIASVLVGTFVCVCAFLSLSNII